MSGCVCAKIAFEWAGADDWRNRRNKRQRCQTAVGNEDFLRKFSTCTACCLPLGIALSLSLFQHCLFCAMFHCHFLRHEASVFKFVPLPVTLLTCGTSLFSLKCPSCSFIFQQVPVIFRVLLFWSEHFLQPYRVLPNALFSIFTTWGLNSLPIDPGSHFPAILMSSLLPPHLIRRCFLFVTRRTVLALMICATSHPSSICPSFANSSALSLPSVTSRSKNVTSCYPSWSDAHQRARLPVVHIIHEFCAPHPKSILRFRANAPHFSHPKPINGSIVVYMRRGGTDDPKEGCQLCPFDGALYLKISIQSTVLFVFTGPQHEGDVASRSSSSCTQKCATNADSSERGTRLSEKKDKACASSTLPLQPQRRLKTHFSVKICSAAEPVSPLQESPSNSEALALLSCSNFRIQLITLITKSLDVRQNVLMFRKHFRHPLVRGQRRNNAPPYTHLFLHNVTRIEPFHLLLFLVVLRNLRLVEVETTPRNAISDLTQDP